MTYLGSYKVTPNNNYSGPFVDPPQEAATLARRTLKRSLNSRVTHMKSLGELLNPKP